MARPKSGVLPCIDCGRDTRPRNSSKDDFPGAVVRSGGKCDTCKAAENPRVIVTPAMPSTVAAHELFLAARNARLAAAARRNNPAGGTA